MSAFIVDKATIDALLTVYVALEREGDGCAEPLELARTPLLDAIGQSLVSENYRSVNYRYQERGDLPEDYTFKPVPITAPLDMVIPRALGALNGYVYQACEHPDWKRSLAFNWTTALRLRLEKRCPKRRSFDGPKMVAAALGWVIDDGERDVVFTERGLAADEARAHRGGY